MPGSLAANQLHGPARAVEFVRDQPQDGVVGRGIHWRSRHPNLQLLLRDRPNLIPGRARLNLDRQVHAIRLKLEAGWKAHEELGEAEDSERAAGVPVVEVSAGTIVVRQGTSKIRTGVRNPFGVVGASSRHVAASAGSSLSKAL